MTNEKENTRISKFLSLVLRHHPESIGIKLDEQGWVEVNLLLSQMNKNGFNINREILEFVVDTNEKRRFALSDDKARIRASQGHSIEVDLGYTAKKPPDVLYHGTAAHSVESILSEGLVKGQRHHVHLTESIHTASQVGSRYGQPVILEVSAGKMHADGYEFFASANNVWLTDHVPGKYLKINNES